MLLEPLNIEGSWLANSPVHSDDRGNFREWFKSDDFEKSIRKKLSLAQANISTSKKGVVRGIHYSIASLGQAKWVTCASGEINDVIVDIRPDSPTYGKHQVINLNAQDGKAVYIGEGLGHGFIALESNTVVAYLVSSAFSAKDEFDINPLDPAIGINWGLKTKDMIFSPKDASAPTLSQRQSEGKLPLLKNQVQ